MSIKTETFAQNSIEAKEKERKKNFLNETYAKNYNESPHRQFIYFDSITSNVYGD